MIEGLWFFVYVLVSLCIWLGLEVSGAMKEARKNVVDGTSGECLMIILWPMALFFFVLMAAPAYSIGWVFKKMANTDLWGER